MGWTWPWKIKALHMWWVALLALWRHGLQHVFQVIPCIEFCYVLGMQPFVVVASVVASCKSKGQYYQPQKYHIKWTAHRTWGKRPWRGEVWRETKLAAMDCSASLAPHFVNNDQVMAEIIHSTEHACHEVLSWTWATFVTWVHLKSGGITAASWPFM